MKNIRILLLAAALVAALSGCTTMDPGQQQAIIGAEVGNAIGTYVLSKSPTPQAVQALQDLAAVLPGIPLGKVTAAQLGAVNRELIALQGTLSATQQTLLDQVGSALALIARANAMATPGGAITPAQALLVAGCTNVALGLQNAIDYSGLVSAPVALTATLAIEPLPVK